MAPLGGETGDGGMLQAKKQKTDMMGGITLSSPISQQQQLQNGPLMMPGQQQSAEIELHDVTFMELAQQLKSRTYSQKGMFKWVRKPSAEMQGIFSAMEQFDRLTKVSVSSDDDGFKEQLMNMQDAYLGIIRSCEHYLATHDPGTKEGELRKQIVDRILGMVKEESPKLEHAATYFKNVNPLLGYSWATVVRSSRTEQFVDGQNGVKLSKAGAGTSELHVIERGQSKAYFKESDTNPEFDIAFCAKKVLEASEEPSLMRRRVLEACAKIPSSKMAELGGTFTDAFAAGSFEDNFFREDSLPAELCALYQDALYDPVELEELKEALKEVGKQVNTGRVTSQFAQIRVGEDLAKRNAVTTRMADALGLESIVARSTRTQVSVNGKEMTGITMEEAKGVTLSSIVSDPANVGKVLRYTPAAMQELSKLHLFDLICGQVDRHQGNYHVTYHIDGDDIFIDHINAFDNDMAFGLISGEDLHQNRAVLGDNLLAIERKQGVLTPAVDADFAYKILSMTPEYMRFLTCDSLSPEEQNALCDRLSSVQATLRKIVDADGKPDDDPNVHPSLKRKILMQDDGDWAAFRDSCEALSLDQKNTVCDASYFLTSFMGKRVEAPKKIGPDGGPAPQG